jgi:hypothetical protein
MTRRQLLLIAAPVLALTILVAGLSPALAADPPNFTGTWVLNTDKGENLEDDARFFLRLHGQDHAPQGHLRPGW